MLARQKCEMQQLSHPNFQLQIYKKINANFSFLVESPSWRIFTLKTSTITLKEEKEKKKVAILVAKDECSEKGILYQTRRISDVQPRILIQLRRDENLQSLLFSQRCMWYLPRWPSASRCEFKSHNIAIRQEISST